MKRLKLSHRYMLYSIELPLLLYAKLIVHYSQFDLLLSTYFGS